MGLQISLSLTDVASERDSFKGKSISLELGKTCVFMFFRKQSLVKSKKQLSGEMNIPIDTSLALVTAVRGCKFRFLLQHYLH